MLSSNVDLHICVCLCMLLFFCFVFLCLVFHEVFVDPKMLFGQLFMTDSDASAAQALAKG